MNDSETSSGSTTTIPVEPKRRSGSVWEIYFPGTSGGHRDSIYVASFPEIIYLWPTVLVLFLCAILQNVVGVDPVTLGWLAIITFSLNLLILVQDFDQKKFIILTLSLVAVFLGAWIIRLYGFTFLQTLLGWFFGFQPQMSTDAYVLFGLILLVLLIWGVVSPLFSYWRLEQNEFIHYTQPIGKDMSIARTGCTIYKEVPDVFECILGFGAGSLVIRRENQVIATIPHIPFLGLRMNSIEHMLSETRVVVEKH